MKESAMSDERRFRMMREIDMPMWLAQQLRRGPIRDALDAIIAETGITPSRSMRLGEYLAEVYAATSNVQAKTLFMCIGRGREPDRRRADA
jgi:hypothetical protein